MNIEPFEERVPYTISHSSIQDTFTPTMNDHTDISDLLEIQQKWNLVFKKVANLLQNWEFQINPSPGSESFDILKAHEIIEKQVIYVVRTLQALVDLSISGMEELTKRYAFEEVIEFNNFYVVLKKVESEVLINHIRVLFNMIYGRTRRNVDDESNKKIIRFYFKSFSLIVYYLNLLHFQLEKERRLYEKRFDDENTSDNNPTTVRDRFENPLKKKIKVVVLGDSFTGKKSLIERILNDTYSQRRSPIHPPSLGPYPSTSFVFDDSFQREEEEEQQQQQQQEEEEEEEEEVDEHEHDDEPKESLKRSVSAGNLLLESSRITIEFITTPEFENFVSIPSQIKRKWPFSDGVVFMYSIDNARSYHSMVNAWIQEYNRMVEKERLRGRNIPMLILGNKSDVELSSLERTIHADEWAKKRNIRKFYQLYGVELNEALDDFSGVWEDSYASFVEMYRNIKISCSYYFKNRRSKEPVILSNDDDYEVSQEEEEEEQRIKMLFEEVEEEIDRLAACVVEKHGNDENGNQRNLLRSTSLLSGRQVESQRVMRDLEKNKKHGNHYYFAEISCLSNENVRESIDCFLYQVAAETGCWRVKRSFLESFMNVEDFFSTYQQQTPSSILVDITEGGGGDGGCDNIGSCYGPTRKCSV